MTNVTALREKLGETQAQFAARLGVNQSTICRWELRGLPKAGTARIAVENLLRELEDRS